MQWNKITNGMRYLTVWHTTQGERRILHVTTSTTRGWSWIHATVIVYCLCTSSIVMYTAPCVCRTWHWTGITLHSLWTLHLDTRPTTLLARVNSSGRSSSGRSSSSSSTSSSSSNYTVSQKYASLFLGITCCWTRQ